MKASQINFSYDRAYARGDSASQLGQISHLDERFIEAFQDLLNVIKGGSDGRLEKSNLMEPELLSCPCVEQEPSNSNAVSEESESEKAITQNIGAHCDLIFLVMSAVGGLAKVRAYDETMPSA